jgi:hypothetical protein
VLGLPVRLGGVTVGTPDRLLRLPARVAERRGPGPCSLLPRSGRVHSCHCRGRPQRRRARCPAAVGARLSGDHRARRRVFDGARSSGPITAFNNLRRPAARDTQSKTGDVAQRLYRPAGCRPKPRGDRRSAAQGLAGITAVKRSHYPPLSRGVHIADAPIELLQGVFRCLSIALHLGFGLTDSSPPLCVLSGLVRVVLQSQPLPQAITTASRGRRRRLLNRGSAA